MSTACLLATDLSTVRLLAEGLDEVWRAPLSDDPDQPAPLREVAAQAADWLLERLPGKRLDSVCLDVDESRCVWIAAPTREPAVIAAALRQRRAEWGESELDGELVQPLVAVATSGGITEQLPMLKKLVPAQGGGQQGVPSAAVFEMPDAAVRLLFDALDIRGVRIGETRSLWHELARRLGPQLEEAGDALCAALLLDESGRLVWAWADAGGLVAGGVCRTSMHSNIETTSNDDAMAAVGRLSLDWLTWSAQLGRVPGSVSMWGAPGPFVDAVRSKWPGTAVLAEQTSEPVRELLLESEASDSTVSDPRRSTPALSRRSSLSHRRVYRLAAVAIGLVAIAVAGLGVRSQQAASRFEAARSQMRADAQDLVRRIAPGYEAQPDLVESLKSFYLVLKRDNPALSAPPVPPGVFPEIDRLLSAAAPIEGVTVNRINIEDRAGSAQFRIATYEDGERLMTALDKSASEKSGTLTWTERVTGSPPNLVIRLTGIWQ